MAFEVNPILTLVSLLSSSVGGGLAAYQQSREAYQQALANEPLKAQLFDLLSRTRQPQDYSGLVESMSRAQSGAYARNTAQGYSRGDVVQGSFGTRESGINRANANSIAAQTNAAIIAKQMEDERARKQLELQILSNPAFGSPDPKSINPSSDAFLGFFAGGLGGVQSSIADQYRAYSQDQSTANVLGLLAGQNGNQEMVTPTFSNRNPSGFGVGYQPNLPSPNYLDYITNSYN